MTFFKQKEIEDIKIQNNDVINKIFGNSDILFLSVSNPSIKSGKITSMAIQNKRIARVPFPKATEESNLGVRVNPVNTMIKVWVDNLI